MSRKTYKTAVVIIPPEHLWPPIQHIRKTHDSRYHRWMPHITLLYPFRPEEEFSSLVEEFSSPLKNLSPFPLSLSRFRYFSHGRNRFTIWLQPEPEEAVRHLQHILWQIVPECDDTRRFRKGFTPHLSVGQIRGRQALRNFMEKWQKTWEPLHFIVEHIALIRRNDPPDDVFRVAEFVPLGKQTQISATQ